MLSRTAPGKVDHTIRKGSRKSLEMLCELSYYEAASSQRQSEKDAESLILRTSAVP